jgi:capsular polysaccharide biosynthesis protein
VELRDYLKIIRKRGWIVLVVALVAGLTAIGVSKMLTPVYRASIQVSVEPARLDWGLSGTIKDILRSYVVRLDTYKMAQKVIDRAQLDMSTDELKSKLTISSDASNYTIQIDAKDTDPIVAKQIAQTMAELFVEEREQWNQQQDQRDRVSVSIVDNVRDVELFSPKTKINALAGAIFGAIVGGLIVLVLEWLESDIVRTPEDVERFVGWTVLGTIPGTPGARQGRRRTFLGRRATEEVRA